MSRRTRFACIAALAISFGVATVAGAGTFTKLNEGDPHPSWGVSRINNMGHVAMTKGTTSAYSGPAWLWTGSWPTLKSFPGSSVGNFTFKPRLELNDRDRIAYATGGDAVRVADTTGVIALGAAPTSLNYFIDINNDNRISAYSWSGTGANRIYGSDDPYTTYDLEVGPTDILVNCVSSNDSGQIAWRPSGTTKNIYRYTPGVGSEIIGSSDFSPWDMDAHGRIIHIRTRNSIMLNNTRLRSSAAVWRSLDQYSQPRVSDNGKHVVWTEWDGTHWNLWTLVDGIPTDLTLGGYNDVVSPDVNNDGLLVFASATNMWVSPYVSDVYLYTPTDPEPIVYNGHFDGETWFRWETIASGSAHADLVARDGGGFAAELTSGSPIAIEQEVDLPTTPSTLRFEIDFGTSNGTLTVGLAGGAIATLTSADDTDSGYTAIEVPIAGAPFAGRDAIVLSFALDDPSTSVVRLDNIAIEAISTGVVSTPASGSLLLLGPARPNPFASETSVRWAGARGDAALAGVYDVRGRLVRELAAPAGGPEEGVLTWNGRGASGEPLPAGVYFLRVRSGEAAESRKVILVR